MPDRKSPRSLSRLLAGCAGRDEACWEEFLHLFGEPLHCLARKALDPDPLHVEDVVQEVLYRMLRCRRTLRARHPGQVLAYLRRTVHSVVKDLHRRRTAGKRTGTADGPPPRAAPLDPEAELVQKDTYIHLLGRAATGRHPARDRTILHAAVIEGWTSRELAPVVDLTPSGVDSAVSRIRHRCRERTLNTEGRQPEI